MKTVTENQIIDVDINGNVEKMPMVEYEQVVEGLNTANSLVVAQYFGRRHTLVINDIKALLSHESEKVREFASAHFLLGDYKDSYGRDTKMYHMTDSGLIKLVSRWSGVAAEECTVAYIKTFNAMRVEITRLQAENFTLLENKTKLLESKVKAFDAKTFEIRDRNSYLEKKRALFIDDHIIKEVTQAYEEATRELRETQDLMYSREWAEGTTKPLAKCLQKLIMARMRNILRVTKNLRKFFKGSELETEYLLNRYIDEIEVEAKHLQW